MSRCILFERLLQTASGCLITEEMSCSVWSSGEHRPRLREMASSGVKLSAKFGDVIAALLGSQSARWIKLALEKKKKN